MSTIPWQDKPENCNDVIWRYSNNPIIDRYAIPSSNSIFNSAVVPFGDGFAGVFRCDNKAVQMNIAIMRAFVEMRKLSLQPFDLTMHLQQLANKLSEHDVQLNQIYEALENLLDEKAAKRKWEQRERIGFK